MHIHIIVPYPPRGSNDMFARAMAQRRAEPLGQPVLVENRQGGGVAGANFTKLPETGDGAVKSYVDRDAKLWGPLITELGIKND